jgi:serine protease Do
MKAIVTRIAMAALGGGMLTGCATSKVVLTGSYSPTNHYERVCMTRMEPGDDPRHVQPKVADCLRSMGFQVEVIDPEDPHDRQGTGFIIGDQGYILTCAHAVGKDPVATVWLGGQRMYTDVVRVDTNADVALLKPQSGFTNRAERLTIVADASLTMGQEVYTLGFPLSDLLGTSPRLSRGLVSATVGLHDDPKTLQISAEVQPGSSGSPLLDQNGDVVGMINSVLHAGQIFARSQGGALPQNVNFATKSDVLISFLNEAGVSIATHVDAAAPKRGFDKIKDSVVLVRSGKVLPGEEDRAELWCRIRYTYFWDMYWRFQTFYLEFVDGKSGKVVIKAGQFGDNLSAENATINDVCRKIQEAIFPGTEFEKHHWRKSKAARRNPLESE